MEWAEVVGICSVITLIILLVKQLSALIELLKEIKELRIIIPRLEARLHVLEDWKITASLNLKRLNEAVGIQSEFDKH